MSPWYSNIVYVLQNLQAPAGLSKTRARSVKLKSAKFCIMNEYLYWKDPSGVLLNCLLENEARQIIEEFHKRDCGGVLGLLILPCPNLVICLNQESCLNWESIQSIYSH